MTQLSRFARWRLRSKMRRAGSRIERRIIYADFMIQWPQVLVAQWFEAVDFCARATLAAKERGDLPLARICVFASSLLASAFFRITLTQKLDRSDPEACREVTLLALLLHHIMPLWASDDAAALEPLIQGDGLSELRDVVGDHYPALSLRFDSLLSHQPEAYRDLLAEVGMA